MKLRETGASINGKLEKVFYRVVKTAAGVTGYEGTVGKISFSFSRQEDQMVFSPTLADLELRKAVMAAVMDDAEIVSPFDKMNTATDDSLE